MTAEEREERLAIMIYDGGMTEEEAQEIISQQQFSLFRGENGI